MLPNPLALIAEITHRCPLHCVYCSNPIQMSAASAELTTRIGYASLNRLGDWEFFTFT